MTDSTNGLIKRAREAAKPEGIENGNALTQSALSAVAVHGANKAMSVLLHDLIREANSWGSRSVSLRYLEGLLEELGDE